MVDLQGIVADLRTEHDALDRVVAAIDERDWDRATPAEGWATRDQISHLAFFDEQALLAIEDPDAFQQGLTAIAADIEAFVDGPVERGRALSPTDLLEWWRTARSSMLRSFEALEAGRRIPWYGPPMSPASFVSARLMETWAHGQDVVDALGIDREGTDRLRHVAHLGVRAFANSYVARGLEVPSQTVRVELDAPSGERWSWNEDATESVRGPALDFCLVVTQRRHRDDTDLVVEGPTADRWMSIAQAFAGPPGSGRQPTRSA